jgi:hypothetical protein
VSARDTTAANSKLRAETVIKSREILMPTSFEKICVGRKTLF